MSTWYGTGTSTPFKMLTPEEKASIPQGPSSPGYVQGTANTVREPWTQPTSQPTSQPSGNSGGGGSRYDELKGIADRGDLNPAQRTEWEAMNQGGQSAEPRWEDMISDMYAPTLSALEEAKKGAQSGWETDTKNLESKVALEKDKYGTEKGNLIEDTQSEQDKFNKVLQSALSEAVRGYNALNQQKMARFGGGSSAGEAVGELARKEYFRQQGQVQQKGVEGTAEFAKERARIGQYISEKISDLDQYKNEAMAELKRNLTSTINEIAMRKGEVEANKTNAKMAALQSARDKVEYLRQNDMQFRRDLGMAAVNQLQQIAGRAFTPAEIKATMAEFGIDMQNLGPGQSQGSTTYANLRANPQSQDELETLNPYA